MFVVVVVFHYEKRRKEMCRYLIIIGVELTAVHKLEYDKQLIESKYSQNHIYVGLMYD